MTTTSLVAYFVCLVMDGFRASGTSNVIWSRANTNAKGHYIDIWTNGERFTSLYYLAELLCYLFLHVSCYAEDGSDMFLRNVGLCSNLECNIFYIKFLSKSKPIHVIKHSHFVYQFNPF
jgi:hypothetical protein